MAIKLFVSLISLFVIGKAWAMFRSSAVGGRVLIGWVAIWLLALVLVWQPGLTDHMAQLLQVGRGTDAVLYLSLLGSLYLFFRLWLANEYTRRELTNLSREMAIMARRLEDKK